MIEQLAGASGYKLYYHPSDKFKTTTIKIFIQGGLDRQVEEQALMPSLLKRGSSLYPTLKAISQKMESLYGGALSLDIGKLGEMQVMVVSMDLVNARFIRHDSDLLRQGIETVNDILLHPILEDGAFPSDRFDQERLNLERYVRSVIDDKIVYTHNGLVRAMFRDEPFGSYEWGDVERIPTLESRGVYRAYRDLLHTAPVAVYVVGNLSREEEKGLPEWLLPFGERKIQAVPPLHEREFFHDGEILKEEQPLEQSKLEMGFRMDVPYDGDRFYALALYNAILGGGSFSKLFKRVREKESRAYYIYSSYDKLKKFLFVASGIERRHFDEVIRLIRACMEEMAVGEITDEEMDHAKRSILTGLQSVADHPGQLIEFDFVSNIAGRRAEAERIIEIIHGLTKSEVTDVATRIYSGKTYFLEGTGNAHGALKDTKSP